MLFLKSKPHLPLSTSTSTSLSLATRNQTALSNLEKKTTTFCLCLQRLTEFEEFLEVDAVLTVTVLQTDVQGGVLQTEPAQSPALQRQGIFITQTSDPLEILLQQLLSTRRDKRLKAERINTLNV